ncbi:hypothetical protein LTR20_008867 [Exophiala xenobiotica]|nr:hypothetical protein LTR79_010081 [Exophiala xenobiotica]KAK5457516.1 hypothetical protein LTR20_008867 [Exophiala xenobiotica]KAK5511459.1 hypothetical protein LTR07_009311 [Exophiala xenobiotica]
MCVWDIFEGSGPQDWMDEISYQVGCDILQAGNQGGDEEDEYGAPITSVEETRNLLDSGKFDEVFEENRKHRQSLTKDGGKVGCFLLTIASMEVGATISDNHKKYLRRHAKTIFVDGNALTEFREALRKYESGVPWHFKSSRYASSGPTDPFLTFSSYSDLDSSATADHKEDAKVSKLESADESGAPTKDGKKNSIKSKKKTKKSSPSKAAASEHITGSEDEEEAPVAKKRKITKSLSCKLGSMKVTELKVALVSAITAQSGVRHNGQPAARTEQTVIVAL